MRHLLITLLATVLFVAPAPRAQACAPAPPAGETVRIADEEALIVWDERTKTEHFVRRASFVSSADAFGFLVPTPTKPDLGEVDSALFTKLAALLAPPILHQTAGVELEPGCTAMWMLARGDKSAAPTAAAPVRVLDTQRVAGFDAVVLAADDPAALSAWLKDRGFAEGPTLTAWLAPYVANGWIITAFKIADAKGAAGARSIGTSSVRMSFAAERPFYPYREPADQRETMPASHREIAPAGRMLRVYFVSDAKFEGALEDGGPFPGVVKLSDAVEPALFGPDLPVASRPRLTVFEDGSSPRPGTADVFFSRAKDQAPVVLEPIVITQPRRIPLPLDLLFVIVGAVAAGLLAVRRRRQRRGRNA